MTCRWQSFDEQIAGVSILKLYYDCEFVEDGETIDLVSIGMVAEDGREYYAVSSEFDQREFCKNPWLMENVRPGLPMLHPDMRVRYPKILVDRSHPAVKARRLIADQVRDFILATPEPSLWAWYAAYDHVALCQLWGRMIDLPKGVPMWTNDLKQECVRLGDPEVPRPDGP
jgi:hypothetical protein